MMNKMMDLTNAIEEIKSQISEALPKFYGIEIRGITRNENSTVGNVYNIKSKDKKYIAKVYDNVEHAKEMSNLFKKMLSTNLNVPKILENNKNESYQNISANKYLMLYEFIEGNAIRL